MAKARIKVGVVGPGGLGSGSIRELQRLPETDLVAVLAFSPDKEGKDAGELVGAGHFGVNATTDFETFLKSDATTVIYTARDYGVFSADEQIIRLLEAGKNVITPLPYSYPKARGGDAEARLRAAAEKGKATLYGTGITPGFFNEKLAMLMTNLTNDVTQIHMQEFFNAQDLANSLQTLTLFGFGGSMEAAEQNIAVAMMAENYLVQPIHFAADKLGLKIDKIVRTSQHKVTEADIETPAMTIKTGTIGLVSYRWTAYVGDNPFYITEVFWYVGEGMRPAVATADDFWTVTIEGRPSLRVLIESKASIAKNEKLFPNDPTPPGYYLTVVTMVQSIPVIEAAPPGIFIPDMPQFHWKPDLRE